MLLLAGLAAAPAAFAAPELSVYITGPEKLQVGLSETDNVSATNDGDVSAPAEVFIIFGSLHNPATSAEKGYNIVVQARGSAPGTGQLVAIQ